MKASSGDVPKPKNRYVMALYVNLISILLLMIQISSSVYFRRLLCKYTNKTSDFITPKDKFCDSLKMLWDS